MDCRGARGLTGALSTGGPGWRKAVCFHLPHLPACPACKNHPGILCHKAGLRILSLTRDWGDGEDIRENGSVLLAWCPESHALRD